MKTEQETDLTRVVEFSTVQNHDMLVCYYRQRLGPWFPKYPYVKIPRSEFLSLLRGSNPILRNMIEEEPLAWDDLMPWFAQHDANFSSILSMHIDSPDVGDKACEFISRQAKTETEKVFHKNMVQLACACQKLHADWKGAPFPYHRIVLPLKVKKMDLAQEPVETE